MDFWIGQPLESEGEHFSPYPAFWSIASKMVTYLLELAGQPHGRGIRPRSLKVTTISALMAEVAKGQANLSQFGNTVELSGCRGEGHGKGLFWKYRASTTFRVRLRAKCF